MKLHTLVATACVGMVMALTAVAAHATTFRSWDPETSRYVEYNTAAVAQASARAGVRRNYSPIQRQKVRYDGPHKPNTIIVDTSDRRLTYVLPDGYAWVYGVGVGRAGFEWTGTHRVTRKAEWPGWTPPKEMIARERARGVTLPAYMEGGINNPLGARALYIGATLYRIHGSNQPWSIGQAVSSGCIRMVNDDVVHLYEQVTIGTRVIVQS